MSLTITVDTRAVSRMLTELQKKQLPYATSQALNRVAFAAQLHERLSIKQTFRQPRPFTQRSVLVGKATKSNLAATVSVRPEVAKYLAPYEFGGLHMVPGKALLVPVHMRLDQYGQLTRTSVARLNAMAADKTSGVFFAEIHGVRGYWQRPKQARGAQRTGGHGTKGKLNGSAQGRKASLTLLAKVERPGPVHEHLNFVHTALQVVHELWPDELHAAIAAAVRSAR